MSQKLNYFQASPAAMNAMLQMEKYVASCWREKKTLEQTLVELVKIRVSQMNGCAYCLDMHTKDARAIGESEQRIYALSAWREAPFFTDRERAGLAWAESLTHLNSETIADTVYPDTKAFFTDEAMVDLTLAITTINAWNRFAVGFGADVGSYQHGDFDGLI